LLEQWRDLEKEYLMNTSQLFQWHRAQLADFAAGLNGIERRFVDLLQRPDNKQHLVDEFVQSFNAFSEEYPDMRKQDETKEEFHQRVDDLQVKLHDVIEQSRSESMAHKDEVVCSGWREAQIDVMASQVQHIVRVEARRYHAACQLLSDFYHSAMGVGLPEARPEPPKIDALSPDAQGQPEVVEEPKKGGKSKGGKAKAAAAPEHVDQEPKKAGGTCCRWVSQKLNEAGEVIAKGYWEFPFLQDLLDQARSWIWKLEDFVPPAAADAPKAKAKGKAAPKADAKGKDKNAGGAQDDGGSAPPKRTDPLYVDLQQALLAERVTYAHRLHMIHTWAEKRMLHIAVSVKDVFDQCDDWVKCRTEMEKRAVEGLVDILKEHIESDPPQLVSCRLTIEGAHLHRHPNVRLQHPAPEIIPPAIEATAPFRWKISQLENLLEVVDGSAKAFRCTGGVVPSRCLHMTLSRLTQDCGEDLSTKEQVLVPANWSFCELDQLQSLCGLFEKDPFPGCVDAVEFMLHMGLLHSPVGWPSLSELLEVRKFLEPLAPSGASWPDFWITPEDIEKAPLFTGRPGNGKEEKFAKQFETATAEEKSLFDRPRAQALWYAKVLRRFPATLRPLQSWELEVSHHDFLVRASEEAERHQEYFDDSKSSASGTPRSGGDGLSSLLPAGQLDASALGNGSSGDLPDERGPKPLPPPPAEPTGLPQCPEGGISVRQLLAYMCLGESPEEGLSRSVAVLGPTPTDGAAVSMSDMHAMLLQLGARPTPSIASGDGMPCLPSLAQMCKEFGVQPSSQLRASDVIGNSKAQAMLSKFGLRQRHCRVQAEKLFPKKAAQQRPRPAPPAEPAGGGAA